MKVCGRCKTEKDDSQFRIRGKRRDLSSYCTVCKKESDREWNKAVKIEAFERYGGVRCVCCGITESAFLALDHEDNNGSIHRKEIGRGTRIYNWLKSHGWPDLKLRVMCHNCNIGRYINGGVCPHKNFYCPII